MATTAALRTEHGTEEMAFRSLDGDAMFVFAHLPRSQPRGGVVICSPVHAEFAKNYRREVLLARALCAQGVAVQRFHYRGCGNSEGDPLALTLDSMRADAEEATRHLLGRTGEVPLAFVGTRLAAFVAAGLAAAHSDASVVLWEPACHPGRYFREVFRARLVRELKEGLSIGSQNKPIEELTEQGWLDVLGYPVGAALYESALERDLDQELGTAPRRLLVLEMTRDAEPGGACTALVDGCRARGWLAHGEATGATEAWWFAGGGGEARQARSMADVVVDATVRHLLGWLTSGKEAL